MSVIATILPGHSIDMYVIPVAHRERLATTCAPPLKV